MKSIILAEDDPTLRTGLTLALQSEGYDVRACENGQAALAAYAERRPDLLLLDVMMPVKSGYDVCVEVRRGDLTTPVIFLTAKSSEEDIVLGLGLGADDFMPKPLRIRELLARVAAALRRSAAGRDALVASAGRDALVASAGRDALAASAGRNALVASAGRDALVASNLSHPAADADIFTIGAATVDCRRYYVSVPGEPQQTLTIRELGLLKMFYEHPDEVLSRTELLDSVWGMDYCGGTRTLDQHIVQIRRKLGADGGLIETVRGIGYRLKKNRERI